MFFKNFPTCTFIWPYTSIRHTRVCTKAKKIVKVLLSNLYSVIHRCLALKKRQIIKLGANKSTHYVAHTLYCTVTDFFIFDMKCMKNLLFSAKNCIKVNIISLKSNQTDSYSIKNVDEVWFST